MVNEEMSVQTPGGWSGTVRGSVAILLVAMSLIGGLVFHYAGVGGAEHREIVTELGMATCILSMGPEDRMKLREDLRREGSGGVATVIRVWCPWVRGR